MTVAAFLPSALGQWLLAEARELGFDDAALVRADLGTPGEEGLRDAATHGRFGPLTWLVESVELRADVQRRFPGARSVLVLAKNYFRGDHDDHVSSEELARGARVSRYAWGGDYHKTMRRRLRKLRLRLLRQAGAAGEVWIFNDVDPVAERAWAAAAGLGFIGKSAMFIHRGFGTWTFLGGLLTTFDLDAPAPREATQLCGTCTACLDACPTGALVAPGQVDAGRCLTTWNVEESLAPEAEQGHLVGHGWAVGCDVCQEVCPWNRFERHSPEQRFAPLPGHVVLVPGALPGDLTGTPLARPGPEGLARSVERALRGQRRPAPGAFPLVTSDGDGVE